MWLKEDFIHFMSEKLILSKNWEDSAGKPLMSKMSPFADKLMLAY
ncbi:hypothetical protein EAKF1_ch3341 [Escherichia albertii KF1]|nr:hypothetical protein EAKF1_ch3341 [Escherichia albertii KF1]